MVTIELALLLELPAPVRLLLLGRVEAFLPTEDEPMVELNCSALPGDLVEGVKQATALVWLQDERRSGAAGTCGDGGRCQSRHGVPGWSWVSTAT